MDRSRLAYFDALGVDVYVRRDLPEQPAARDPVAAGTPATPEAGSASPGTAGEPGSWQELRTRVAQCTRCELHATRSQTVFGTGSTQARWMFIGEAPGAEEDRQGEPFVGRAGQLLNAMLRAVGLSRQQVYIANILKCRPPRNRDPRPAEAASCREYLDRQIELLDPVLIVAIGRIAAQNLLATDAALGRLRGRVHELGAAKRPVIVTYHPAYLLRSPREKRKAWSDLLFAAREFRRFEAARQRS
jgi:uracil-DNA glycosylase family 4